MRSTLILVPFLLVACANPVPPRISVGEPPRISVGEEPVLESIPPERWVGTYEAGESCGQTLGGTPVWAKHTLRVLFEDGILVAYLEADGYMTMTRLKGAVHLFPDRMAVTKLDGFGDPDLKRGDALVMLVDVDGILEVVWGAKYRATCGE